MANGLVVLLVDYPFSQRDYERFGVEIFRRCGYSVAVWDFAPLLHPGLDDFVDVPDAITLSGLRRFASWREAKKAFAQLESNSLLVAFIGYSAKTIPLFRTMSNRRLCWGVVTAPILPPLRHRRETRAILKKLAGLPLPRLWESLVVRIPPATLGIEPAQFVVCGGSESGSHRLVNRNTSVIWTHTFDYDLYLKEQTTAAGARNAPYGVFLDEYLPFHPDHAHSRTTPYASADEYYPLLRRFFDQVEQLRGVPIVIAAHPRSLYEKHKADYFGGRSIVRGQTGSLVAHSDFVIAHASTALNFAILFRKPLLFVTSDRFRSSLEYAMRIEQLAELLGKQPINLDSTEKIDWDEQFLVDRAAYDSYREAYIKRSGTPDLPVWQIFADRIPQITSPT